MEECYVFVQLLHTHDSVVREAMLATVLAAGLLEEKNWKAQLDRIYDTAKWQLRSRTRPYAPG